MPAVYTIDLTNSNWDWQKAQLIPSSVNGGAGSVPGFNGADNSSSNGLSTAVMAVIIAVAVVVSLLLFGLALYWIRRRAKQKSSSSKGQMEKMLPEISAAAAIGYTPVYTESAGSMMHGQAFTSGSRSGSMMQSDKHELSETEHVTTPAPPLTTTTAAAVPNSYPPAISRAWSGERMVVNQPVYGPVSNYSTIPATTATIPAVSLPIPVMQPANPVIFMPAPAPVTMQNLQQQQSTPVAGDKMELVDEVNGTSFQQSEGGFLSVGADEKSRRLQGMVSPGLANAQLILQRSQTPQNVLVPPNGGDGSRNTTPHDPYYHP
ncbi:hypothetical protein BGX28_007479 [Mortierella sp. GBA30]|nr:hypothetical protein BGX28_007479 [Mortierella sp. GBA30]